jgi:hypothetical protein
VSRVRLALLGPCDDDVAALARAAHTALIKLSAGRVIYLGGDDALDCVVYGWADLLDAIDPLELRIDAVIDESPARIDDAIAREKLRQKLSVFRSLPGPSMRSIEMLHDRVVLLVDDKKELDEEDLLPATFIVFGRGEPTIRRVGSRVFLCPGSPAKRKEGVVVLEEGDTQGAVIATLHDIDGNVIQRELLETTRGTKMKVQGA